ncbi:carbon-nitrogen hydrolase family protein [Wenjunlia tyrosinilytica]|uniref:Nitrilase n=1 Tax=Wenjunlia tyrosinilytica TaxID=1544741 RepID=A0A917ZX31_9ACTN|nr:carbon-nitrogen hydrolase family protein [Wenjunlia tyrosinilytica]GGO96602.1 nitrilase [Wenjunlia tyrosinilytica]
MRSFTAAAVQVAPRPGPLTPSVVEENIGRAADWVTRCVESTGAELVVLPESVSTGFTPALGPEELWDLVDEVPGVLCDPLRDRARELGVHLVWGTYERGDERGVVHNSAVVAGPDGQVLGVYRKTHPFGPELASRGGWVTPGDRVTVVETELGRIGMVICFDGDYPELSRIQAVRGAEIICRPSALLRSADLWELTCRARAYDNHVYVIGANATGVDPGGVLYFGNSLIVSPGAEVVARGSSHESWVAARLDPQRALAALTPGSSVPQVFDHLRDRNLDLVRRYADDLTRPAESSFPHG